MKTPQEFLREKYPNYSKYPRYSTFRYDEVIKLMQEYADQKPDWIPVSERLPENKEDPEGSIYCLVVDLYYGVIVRPYQQYHKCWYGEDDDDYYCDAIGSSITHWMPLPEVPEKKSKN